LDGHGVQTRKPYDNRYVSVITIHDRKVTHWRDYWNPQVVLNAVGGLEPLIKSMNEVNLGSDYSGRATGRT
jgi:hypothetical protein